MPALIRVLTPAGLEAAAYSAQSLAEAARYEPHDGIYTITNTYERTKALKLDAHLDRMESSAVRADVALKLERAVLRAALRQVILEAGYAESRFRITVPKSTPDRFILSVEPYAPPADGLVHGGVGVVTVPSSARSNPAAKTLDWLHDRESIEKNLPSGAYTALLCDEGGHILEGLSSNFYAILDGELRTAGSGVLPGIAQQIVFEVAPLILPVRQEAVRVDDIPMLQEAFITSSSRGIIPVVRIDGTGLSGGRPGIYTLRLQAAYSDWAWAHLEEI